MNRAYSPTNCRQCGRVTNRHNGPVCYPCFRQGGFKYNPPAPEVRYGSVCPVCFLTKPLLADECQECDA